MFTPTYTLEKVVRSGSRGLEDFEGPLDLILYLLSKNKIEIREIKISSLLQQYLEHLEQMKRMDLEIASEFLAMAAHLVYLKSKMLLSLSEEEPPEEMDELMQAIEARRRQEEARRVAFGVNFLTERPYFGASLFARSPECLKKEAYAYRHDAQELARTLLTLFDQAERRLPPKPASFQDVVVRDTLSLEEVVERLRSQLRQWGAVPFSRLLSRVRSRSEHVALFLAVLELCRNREVILAAESDDSDNDFTLDLRPISENTIPMEASS